MASPSCCAMMFRIHGCTEVNAWSIYVRQQQDALWLIRRR